MTSGRKPWRVEHRTMYDADNNLLGMMETPELSIEVVLGVNVQAAAAEEPPPPSMFQQEGKDPEQIFKEIAPGIAVNVTSTSVVQAVRASNPAAFLTADEAAFLLMAADLKPEGELGKKLRAIAEGRDG